MNLQRFLTILYSGVTLFFIAVLLGLGTPGCGRAKMRVVNSPPSAPVPPNCPVAPVPPIRLYECYEGKKLVLRVYATSILDLKPCDGVKCVVR